MRNHEPTRADAPMPKARRLLSVAAVAVAAFAVFPAVSAAASCPKATIPPPLISPPDYQASILCLLNAERHDRGLVALGGDAQLAQAAAGHSENMRHLSYFEHTDPDGTTFLQRITTTGYLQGTNTWLVGENLAWGSLLLGTPRALVNAWMHSPPHRANVLESRYRDVGIGAVSGSPNNPLASSAIIVTADFGVARGKSAAAGKAKKKHKKKRRRHRR
jgi:uncharacterized protein YkwD